jgi:hypothetical protein
MIENFHKNNLESIQKLIEEKKASGTGSSVTKEKRDSDNDKASK